ncbi:hypothetical protein [Bacillus thuringiensis]|uniref:Uncharacterized protein n=1 Tax=Bacillus thuringiensis TaxID=1428 RepID=A0A9X6YCY3_BACTU|nr:hypothetical protein [Bacillus thuringiensis]PEA92014.1 hypothetical protein CON71_00210 [Bacillus thuringiensis]
MVEGLCNKLAHSGYGRMFIIIKPNENPYAVSKDTTMPAKQIFY